MDIGVRELKAHLSEMLDRAATGEIIRVTDRGHAKAVLGPIPGQAQLRSGLSAGWITRQQDIAPRPVKRHRARRSIADVLDVDRLG